MGGDFEALGGGGFGKCVEAWGRYRKRSSREADRGRVDFNTVSAPTGSAWAAFFALNGSLSVNGAPAVGRSAITEVAQGFMTAFPDMQLLMDGVVIQGGSAVYHWTFIGSNTGPGGTGHRVRFSGYEVWRFGEDGLIAESQGHFD